MEDDRPKCPFGFGTNRDIGVGGEGSLGPYRGLKVIEIAGLAPAPFCGMILSDFGADVVRVDRIPSDGVLTLPIDIMSRGKRSVCINLKSKEGVDILLKMIERADVFIEPFRPGVAEKLGFGPSIALEKNPSLIYARLTGWGQTGPYSNMAGHDINYIALSGSLSLIGRKDEPPVPPVNLLGDFAAGGMLCALGIAMALFEVKKTGNGQVVDSSMMDGAAYLSTFIHSLVAQGIWKKGNGTNFIDTGSHFYEVYKTKDGKYLSVGAIEPQFYDQLLKGLELDPSSIPENTEENWDKLKKIFRERILTKTRDEWEAIFHGKDACVAPVLTLDEAPEHPQSKARHLFFKDKEGHVQPSPAPLLSKTPGFHHSRPYIHPGQHSRIVLMEYGIMPKQIETLAKSDIIWEQPTRSSL